MRPAAGVVIGAGHGGQSTGGAWRLEERLGQGGMGEVWRAVEVHTGGVVAVKLIPPGALDAELVARFQREAELAARVDAAGGVARIHALRPLDGGALALVQELVPGEGLERAMRTGLERARLVRIVAALAATLARIHAAGVVHRDVKPSNIILRAGDDAPVLIDFGLAWSADSGHLTQTGVILGTPAYMAPEQARDAARAHGPEVDVHALGAILFHGLTGRLPREIAGLAGLVELARGDPPPDVRSVDPTTDATLAGLVRAALDPDPARRPTAAALAAELARWRPGARRDRRALVATAALWLLLIGAVGVRVRARSVAAARFALSEHAREEPELVRGALDGQALPAELLAQRLLELERAEGLLAEDEARLARTHATRMRALLRVAGRDATDAPGSDDPVVRALDARRAASAGRRTEARRLASSSAAVWSGAWALERSLLAAEGDAALLAWAAGLAPGDARRDAARVELGAAWARLVHRSVTRGALAELRALAPAMSGAPDEHARAVEATADLWAVRLGTAIGLQREREDLAALAALLGLVPGAAVGPSLEAALDRACDQLVSLAPVLDHRLVSTSAATREAALRAVRFGEAARRLPGARRAPRGLATWLGGFVRSAPAWVGEAADAEVLVAAVHVGATFGPGVGLAVLGKRVRAAPVQEQLARLAAREDGAALFLLSAATYVETGEEPERAVIAAPAVLGMIDRALQGDLAPRYAAEARVLAAHFACLQARAPDASPASGPLAEALCREAFAAAEPWPIVRQYAVAAFDVLLCALLRQEELYALWSEQLRLVLGCAEQLEPRQVDEAVAQALSRAVLGAVVLGRFDEQEALVQRILTARPSGEVRAAFALDMRDVVPGSDERAWRSRAFVRVAGDVARELGDAALARTWLDRARAALGSGDPATRGLEEAAR